MMVNMRAMMARVRRAKSARRRTSYASIGTIQIFDRPSERRDQLG